MSLCRERDAVDVAARVLWDERAARLKLVMPGADRAEFEVPGGTVERGPCGEVPGGRWVRADGRRGRFGFASDALYCFDLKKTPCGLPWRAPAGMPPTLPRRRAQSPGARPWTQGNCDFASS